MATKKFRYVTCMGMLYRLSENNYLKMLKEWSVKGGADIDDFGVLMGSVSNVTDMSSDDALDEISHIEQQRAHAADQKALHEEHMRRLESFRLYREACIKHAASPLSFEQWEITLDAVPADQ